MKITLKTIILAALLAFFIMIIISNFSNFEGFSAYDADMFSSMSGSSYGVPSTTTTSSDTKKSDKTI
jgi:uncharacterized membrane protein